jgi:hypothetical protein
MIHYTILMGTILFSFFLNRDVSDCENEIEIAKDKRNNDHSTRRKKKGIETSSKYHLLQDLKKRGSHTCDMQALRPLPVPTAATSAMSTSGRQTPHMVSETA